MKASILKQYHSDPNKALELNEFPTPEPGKDEVLVKIHASSLNPIDARIRRGYGKTILSEKAQLPIVLGRDFSGIIVKRGELVKDYITGDLVFGAVSPFRASGLKQGSHAEFVSIPTSEIIKKPNNVTHLQAASLPYVALTSYSALISHTGMRLNDYSGKHVFVHAGAGGVGSYAIQFLKALGAHVTTTCSTNNIDYVRELGANEVIDYTKEDYRTKVKNYDVAYDLLGTLYTSDTVALLKSMAPSNQVASTIETLLETCLNQLKSANDDWHMPIYKEIISYFNAELATLLKNPPIYASIVSPMMPLTDQNGLHLGMQQFISETLKQKASQAIKHGRCFNYSFFELNYPALELLAEQIVSNKIKPSVDKVFSLDEASKAHQAIETNRTRGKIVFSME